jgi:hypothetical protein
MKILKISSDGSCYFTLKTRNSAKTVFSVMTRKKDDSNFYINQKKETNLLDLSTTLSYKIKYLK